MARPPRGKHRRLLAPGSILQTPRRLFYRSHLAARSRIGGIIYDDEDVGREQLMIFFLSPLLPALKLRVTSLRKRDRIMQLEQDTKGSRMCVGMGPFFSLAGNCEVASWQTYAWPSSKERTREIMIQFGKDAMELHDITAVWCAIDNPPRREPSSPGVEIKDGWQFLKRSFQIERYARIPYLVY